MFTVRRVENSCIALDQEPNKVILSVQIYVFFLTPPEHSVTGISCKKIFLSHIFVLRKVYPLICEPLSTIHSTEIQQHGRVNTLIVAGLVVDVIGCVLHIIGMAMPDWSVWSSTSLGAFIACFINVGCNYYSDKTRTFFICVPLKQYFSVSITIFIK